MTAEDTPTTTQDAPGAPAPAEEREPIAISQDLLTEEAKARLEERTGLPHEDVPYSLVSEEERPNCVVRLVFEVSSEAATRAVDRIYASIRKEIVLPGFRKGKAPVSLIRLRMGAEAGRDAVADIAANVLRQEHLKRTLPILNDVQALVVDWTLETGKPLAFTVEFERALKPELKNYKGLSVKSPLHPVTEEAVEADLERFRGDYSTRVNAPADHALGEQDAVVLDIRVTGPSGQEIETLRQTGWLAYNFKSQLPGEVSAALEGRKTGEIVEVPVKTERRNRRGEVRELIDTWTVTVKSIKTRVLPDLDDAFAREAGDYADLAALRADLRAKLEAAARKNEDSDALGSLLLEIAKVNPFDIPFSVVRAVRNMNISAHSRDLRRYGLELESVVRDLDEYFIRQHVSAEMQIRQSIIFQEIARLESLDPSEEEVNKAVEELAAESGRKPLAVLASLEAEKRLDSFKAGLRDRKVREFLLTNNTVERVPPDQFTPPAPEPAEESGTAAEAPAEPQA